MGSIGSVHEGREAADIDSGREGREMGDVDWAVGHREKDGDPMAAQRVVGSLDLAGKSFGEDMDCSGFEGGIAGNLLGCGICGRVNDQSSFIGSKQGRRCHVPTGGRALRRDV